MNSKTTEKENKRCGSVLLLTLLVVSLLLVIALAFVVLVRLELRNFINHHQLSQARANARLGTELAIARLQELAGPDQRATARGDLFSPGSDQASSNISGLSTPAGNTRLVGVWDSRNYDENAPQEHAASAFLGWMVSGMSAGSSAAFNEPAPGASDQDSVLLIGPGSVSEPEDYVYGKRMNEGKNQFAWVVDDLGLKAQLKPGGRIQIDTLGTPSGGGVIPGAFDCSVLNGMSSLSGEDPLRMQRLLSLSDLPLMLGPTSRLSKEKYFDYTFRSQGVLSDAKTGGLKRDLTIAFENAEVFDKVFPDTEPERYLLLDKDKIADTDSADLRLNGYIHWRIFRDYYNLKKYILNINNMDVIDSHYFAKDDLVAGTLPAALGTIAPHNMGASTMPPRHREQPYGDLVVTAGREWLNPTSKHNHIGPVLSFMQQNAWLEYTPPVDGDAASLSTHVQLWTGHYNPYNIRLAVYGSGTRVVGPRVHNYPEVYFQVSGFSNGFNTAPGLATLGGRREVHAGPVLYLQPGESQVYGVERVGDRTEMPNRGLFGPNILENISANVTGNHELSVLPTAGNHTVTVTFEINRSIGHGSDMSPAVTVPGVDDNPQDMEITQFIYAPFAWDTSNGYPAKIKTKTVPLDEMTENTRFTAGFSLRTTRESAGEALRPLIDGNIRAPWVNPRWDSPLDLETAAIYSNDREGVPSQTPPSMQARSGGTGFAYWGASNEVGDGSTRVILFDVPREDLVSLGQLQHAAAGRFSYEPTYIVGNSYANPRIPQNKWRGVISDTFSTSRGLTHRIPGSFNLYDASYLVNQHLWDSYVFTTIPQVRDNYTAGEPQIDYSMLRDRTIQLPNPRFIPYDPKGSIFTEEVLKDTGDSSGTVGAFFHNAGHLMVDGAFNINSTSVDAWEAFLTGTANLPVQAVDTNGTVTGFKPVGGNRVRYPRVKSVLGEGMDRENPDVNYWTGFRELQQSEVRALAEAIVIQVKKRGPFLNMGQFVNRYLRADDLGKAGALQTALDATVNHGLDVAYALAAGAISNTSSQGAGFPGQLLQGDILQALSPMMQVRSDTFKIRAYGGYNATHNGDITRAWCEAVVQRVPEPVDANAPGSDLLLDLANPQSPFGRQFRIVSFRWLSEEEI